MQSTPRIAGILAIVLSSLPTGYSKPASCGQETWLLDQALKATSVAETRAAALQTLENVAEGKPKAVVVATALKAGLNAFARPDGIFEFTCLRTYAMDRIGASGLPESIEYLRSVTPASVAPDGTETVYPAAQLALYKALFRQTDPDQQTAFLEHQLRPSSHGAVAAWAVNELCDRGSLASLDEIEKVVKRWWSGQYGEDQFRFCEARVKILNRDPDRLRALASALTMAETESDSDLNITRWVIVQLSGMQSSDADAVLDRYVAEVEKRFPDVPAVMSIRHNVMLLGLAQEIRELQLGKQGAGASLR